MNVPRILPRVVGKRDPAVSAVEAPSRNTPSVLAQPLPGAYTPASPSPSTLHRPVIPVTSLCIALLSAMEPVRRRRRQHHSCDQCRKGKRACDATIREDLQSLSPSSFNLSNNPPNLNPSPCSNCRRWKKECTFNWLYSYVARKKSPEERRKKKKANRDTTAKSASIAGEEPSVDAPPVDANNAGNGSHDVEKKSSSDDDAPFPVQWLPPNPNPNPGPGHEYFLPFRTSVPESQLSWKHQATGNVSESWEDPGPSPPLNTDAFGSVPWNAKYSPLSLESTASSVTRNTHDTFDPSQSGLPDTVPSSVDDNLFIPSQFGSFSPPDLFDSQPFPFGIEASESSDDGFSQDSLDAKRNTRSNSSSSLHLLFRDDPLSPSHTLSTNFERTAMTQDLLRIYHDSMENALSCWLTEKTCPYSGSGAGKLLKGLEKEWGPNWSNRICTRVCRLDRVYSAIRGRKLSATEDKAASRALHTSIMAFAVQWARHSQRRMRAVSGDAGSRVSPLNYLGRSVQEDLWNQAHHALNKSIGIPSARVMFANFIFALTQRPLNVKEHIQMMDSKLRSGSLSSDSGLLHPHRGDDLMGELHDLQELFDMESAPAAMVAALRQLFTLRYKLGIKREQQKALSWKHPDDKQLKQQSFDPDSSVITPEDQETFNLLLWLGIMFDTLTAAMHQSPPIISDEDSNVTEPSAASTDPHDGSRTIDLDGWSTTYDGQALKQKQKRDVWGDFFLSTGQSSKAPHWPCSYQDAAEILCVAAQVKVLLFRRVSHLQTLIYRCTDPDRLEEAIQNALLVVRHWKCTYGQFTLNCIANHDSLPPRLQSWYVIVAGHWHLASMLLADTLESIDKAELGQSAQRESRQAMNLVPSLRRENAYTVCTLAFCSLRQQDSFSTPGQTEFQLHDSVNDGVFLSEPWTEVLVRSFTKAGYIVLNEANSADIPPHPVHVDQQSSSGPSEYPLRQVSYCIDALWCLGKKSDLAFIAARALSQSLERKIREKQQLQTTMVSLMPEYLAAGTDGSTHSSNNNTSRIPLFSATPDNGEIRRWVAGIGGIG